MLDAGGCDCYARVFEEGRWQGWVEKGVKSKGGWLKYFKAETDSMNRVRKKESLISNFLSNKETILGGYSIFDIVCL